MKRGRKGTATTADGVVKNQKWVVLSSWCYIIITTHTKKVSAGPLTEDRSSDLGTRDRGAHQATTKRSTTTGGGGHQRRKNNAKNGRGRREEPFGRASGCCGGNRGLIGRHSDSQRNERGRDFGAFGTNGSKLACRIGAPSVLEEQVISLSTIVEMAYWGQWPITALVPAAIAGMLHTHLDIRRHWQISVGISVQLLRASLGCWTVPRKFVTNKYKAAKTALRHFVTQHSNASPSFVSNKMHGVGFSNERIRRDGSLITAIRQSFIVINIFI